MRDKLIKQLQTRRPLTMHYIISEFKFVNHLIPENIDCKLQTSNKETNNFKGSGCKTDSTYSTNRETDVHKYVKK